MFDWLLPSFLMQNISSNEKPQTQLRILGIHQLNDLYTLSHPFLTCPETIAHLRQTKVMFLMRGLPGSGKSTIVTILKRIYSKSVVVCSADNYFIDSQGNYNFNRDKISDAHLSCQRHTEDACKNNILAVIVDNTNIRVDECKPYFQKATNYGYVVIVVEPRTSWKRDANILIDRNAHGVPIDIIEARLRAYHPLIPFYFGLFLNHEQSNYVLQEAYDYYQQALQTFPQLKKELEQISRDKNISVHNLLNRANMSVQTKILHCTMKFIGKVTDQTRKDYTNYAANRLISHSLGKMFRAYIVGFTITPRTLGARLLFPDCHTWALWDQDDNELPKKESSSQIGTSDNKKSRPFRHNNKSKVTTATTDNLNINDDYDTSMVRSLADDDILLVDKVLTSNISEKVTFLHPTFGYLSRAHLTCGVAPGINASQTGHDIIEMIQKESDIIQKNFPIPESNDERTVMRFFGNGRCIIYLKEPIPIETIFGGYFH
ncbi:unnamed protein product [Rotaria sp. Silwood2]|nr:unnamed protein product [Rotaria sp. Silwood2]CAF2885214.1 unnamed protein product [Rotaria sp. Silwood2]CAF4028730.1 unnamed protein product [Rotaria sp. Silwood2]CAF4120472.1 unnamed protein product [Rotaria sp. Silwood2]CAF4278146.1 unnamed protein product [Rotaria sp. Silwood2]